MTELDIALTSFKTIYIYIYITQKQKNVGTCNLGWNGRELVAGQAQSGCSPLDDDVDIETLSKLKGHRRATNKNVRKNKNVRMNNNP